MSSLQAIAMGLVVVALDTLGTVDLLPDALGWLLVIYGVWRLALPERNLLLVLAAVAGVISSAVWLPGSAEALREADVALRWASSIPDLAFVFVLARGLLRAARSMDPPDDKLAWRFLAATWAAVLVALLPPIADAADSDGLLQGADAAFVCLWLWLIWNLFAAHARPYAQPRS